MNHLYTFSYWVQSKAPRIVRRPWWHLFGRDTLVWEPAWREVRLDGLNENQAGLIQNATQVEELSELFTSLICRPGESVARIQLSVQHPVQEPAAEPVLPEPGELRFDVWRPKVGGEE